MNKIIEMLEKRYVVIFICLLFLIEAIVIFVNGIKIFSLIPLIISIGLYLGKNWARKLGVFLIFIHCLVMPQAFFPMMAISNDQVFFGELSNPIRLMILGIVEVFFLILLLALRKPFQVTSKEPINS